MSRIRITRWYLKLLYVVAAAIIIYAIALIADPSRAGDSERGILRSAAILVLTLVGARIFRGRNEDVAPARAWWRATGGWLAGLLLTVVWAVTAAGSIGVGLGQAGTLAPSGTVVAGAALGATGVILAIFYGQSSVRLIIDARRAAREARNS